MKSLSHISDKDCSHNSSIKRALFSFTKRQRESWQSLATASVDTLVVLCCILMPRVKIKQWNTLYLNYHALPAETMAEYVPVQLKRQKNQQRQVTNVNIGTPGWTFWNQPFPFLCHRRAAKKLKQTSYRTQWATTCKDGRFQIVYIWGIVHQPSNCY